MDRAQFLPVRYLAHNIILRAEVNQADIESLQGCSRALFVKPRVKTSVNHLGELFAKFGFVAISQVRGSSSIVVEYQDIQAVYIYINKLIFLFLFS